MAGGQERKQPSRSSGENEEPEPTSADAAQARKDKIDSDVDAILDEIDDVLEENAAEFVSSFVQKGGE